MGLDGFGPDKKVIGDLKVGAALCHEVEHLALSASEALQPWVGARRGLVGVFQEFAGQGREDEGFSVERQSNGVEKVGWCNSFEEEPGCSRTEGLIDVFVELEGGQKPIIGSSGRQNGGPVPTRRQPFGSSAPERGQPMYAKLEVSPGERASADMCRYVRVKASNPRPRSVLARRTPWRRMCHDLER